VPAQFGSRDFYFPFDLIGILSNSSKLLNFVRISNESRNLLNHSRNLNSNLFYRIKI
jgi:hypothetical protein